MMWDNSWGAGQWVAMSMMMVVFWGLIVVAVVSLVRWNRGEAHASVARRENDAMRILDERFARGEIDADEYAHRRELLDGTSRR